MTKRRRAKKSSKGKTLSLKGIKSEVARLRSRVNKLDPARIAKKAAKEAEESLASKYG